ncbi:hypothetical protein AMK16_33270 [Streptomyces sp. CB00455]|nr:hypothetical protein AMK16_33270 [Streptomyces sp. CB00455]
MSHPDMVHDATDNRPSQLPSVSTAALRTRRRLTTPRYDRDPRTHSAPGSRTSTSLGDAMRRKIAEHSDLAIRDACADFVRTMVERGVPTSIDDLVP